MPITPLPPTGIDSALPTELPPIPPLNNDRPVESGGFADALTGALAGAGAAEKAANTQSEKFAAGDPSVGIHEVMIAAEKATIAVRYAVTLKNKVLEAYRELMNTPV